MTGGDTTPQPHEANRILTAAGWALLISFVAICAWLGRIDADVRLFQIGYSLGFVGYALLMFCVCRRRPRGHWSLWVVGSILLRVALLDVAPSDDAHRYLWEGRIQVAGHNPYAVTPDDPKLKPLRNQSWRQINHRDYPAIYPPVAQLVFRAVAAVRPTLQAMKTTLVGFDCVAIVLLAAWLRRLGRSPHLAVVYALCPLTLASFAVEGHVDAVMIAFLAGAGLAHAHRRIFLCAACLAGAILAKLMPILLLLWLFRQKPAAAVLAVVLVIAGTIPYADAGGGLLDSLIRFGATTQMLSPAVGLFSWMLGDTGGRLLCVLIVLSVAMWHSNARIPLFVTMRSTFGALIVFMPVVHYWYLSWVLVALPFGVRLSWLILAASMGLYFEAAHLRATTGAWAMPPWVLYGIYGPFLIAWIFETLVARIRSRPASVGNLDVSRDPSQGAGNL